MFNFNINVDPRQYVIDKKTNLTIDNKTNPLTKVEKIDNNIYVTTRRFSHRDRSEINPMKEKITLKELNNEKNQVLDYLNNLNILINDVVKLNNIGETK